MNTRAKKAAGNDNPQDLAGSVPPSEVSASAGAGKLAPEAMPLKADAFHAEVMSQLEKLPEDFSVLRPILAKTLERNTLTSPRLGVVVVGPPAPARAGAGAAAAAATALSLLRHSSTV